MLFEVLFDLLSKVLFKVLSAKHLGADPAVYLFLAIHVSVLVVTPRLTDAALGVAARRRQREQLRRRHLPGAQLYSGPWRVSQRVSDVPYAVAYL